VKLLDFGIAKLTSDEPRMSMTQTGYVLGTPSYLSPEQARGGSVDARTDLYALGVVAFELFLGRLPFIANQPFDVMVQHVQDEPPRPSSIWAAIPPALDDLLWRMLSKEPASRPSLAEVRATLARLAAGEPIAADRFAPPVQRAALALTVERPAMPFAEAPADEAPRPRRRLGRLVTAGLSTLMIFAAAGVLRWKWPVVAPRLAQIVPFAPTLFGKISEPKPAAPSRPMTLVLTVDAPHAELTIDDHRVEMGQSNGLHVELESFIKHELSVSAPGRAPFHRRFSAGAGEVLRISAELPHR
jgi:serine/threonine-protein kinase